MRTLIAEPITADAFAPFGVVLAPPSSPGRDYFDGPLANARPGARPSLSLALVEPASALTLDATVMERHEFSSQSFVPIDGARYLVCVAPHASDGGPDTGRARAFIAEGGLGITYGANVWHHPMVCLDRLATFAILMWLDGSERDTELVTLTEPFRIDVREQSG